MSTGQRKSIVLMGADALWHLVDLLKGDPIPDDSKPPYLRTTAAAIKYWCEIQDNKECSEGSDMLALSEVLSRIPTTVRWYQENGKVKLAGQLRTRDSGLRQIVQAAASKILSLSVRAPERRHVSRQLCEAVRREGIYLESLTDRKPKQPLRSRAADGEWSEILPLNIIARRIGLIPNSRMRAVKPRLVDIGSSIQTIKHGSYRVQLDTMDSTYRKKFG